MAGIDPTPVVKYRRAWSMAVHQGKLFCGTLPSGKVFAVSAGGCVTHDWSLPTGWQQIAAVRKGNELRLYLNGKRVGEQALSGKLAEGNFSSDAPLIIGAGITRRGGGH
ncbi:MAG: LamG-like jellyroll fold domain-containing protein [Planctomycetales bacterium]